MLLDHNSSFSSAYMLIVHGSKDIRSQWAMQKLAHKVRTLLKSQNVQLTGRIKSKVLNFPDHLAQSNYGHVINTVQIQPQNHPMVRIGTLELASLSLHEQIQKFALEAQQAGYKQVKVLPLFLLSGVHVEEDIFAEIKQAQAMIGNNIAINALPYLGSYSDLTRLLFEKFVRVEADTRVILSHGTKRLNGNQTVEQVAKKLGSVVAYLSVAPFLQDKIEILIASGKKHIAIQPYLIFEGAIMDAMAQEVKILQKIFPQTELLLGEPLGATAGLATLIVDKILRP